ncbi:hypothetical protein BJP65_07955 [Microbacterium sp. BH-3-3-3]|nr:hypothetical protein BJP65_07955 [Microbacterium sp. BH-3-3-3]
MLLETALVVDPSATIEPLPRVGVGASLCDTGPVDADRAFVAQGRASIASGSAPPSFASAHAVSGEHDVARRFAAR